MMAFRTVMYAAGLVSLVVYLANLKWVRTLTNPGGQGGDRGRRPPFLS